MNFIIACVVIVILYFLILEIFKKIMEWENDN